jgi:phosphoribosylaminoimidazole carboxylase (NCAIR synthetase)
MTIPPEPIVPPATVGMLGGGQLGKYALIAANAMGYRTIVVDPDAAAPARVVADEHVQTLPQPAPVRHPPQRWTISQTTTSWM